jgi:O-antigen ligase
LRISADADSGVESGLGSIRVETVGRSPLRDAGKEGAIKTLQVYAITLMVFPSDMVIKAVGAGGYVASLVAMFVFAAWAATTLLGFHAPVRSRNPVRAVLALLWVVSLVSYVLMHLDQRSPAEGLAADRWMMQLMGATGVIVVAGGMLRSLDDVRRAQRAIVWGGAFCAFIGALQFWFSLDLTFILRMLPGFSVNSESAGILSRAALNRVSGTASHPIELGAVAAMILPLAINLGIYDTVRKPWRRWLPVVLVISATATSVSRSAILTFVVAMVTYILLLPAAKRVAALALMPLAVVAAFFTIPGLLTTLTSFFSAGTSDPSISTRVDDYPFVERTVAARPWFGQGGGTFLPTDLLQILDNQYLKTAIELGIIGLIVFCLFLVIPAIAAFTARRALVAEEAKSLCAALGGSCLAAAVGSFTFDSWSFPMFIGVHAYILGLVAACWGLGVADDVELMRGTGAFRSDVAGVG